MSNAYYYYWDEGNYTHGFVVGLTSLKEARKHAKDKHPSCKDIDVKRLKQGEVLDVYCGE